MPNISSGDTGHGTDAASVGQYKFTPPSFIDLFQMRDKASFFISMTESYSVLKTSGSYKTVTTPSPEDIQAADIAYLGGRSYPIDTTERTALIAAGYGAYVVLMPIPS